MTGSVLNGIEKAKTDLEAAGIAKQGSIAEADQAASEVLCALYCLSVAILGEDEFAAERNLFHLYTAKASEDLQSLLREFPTAISMESLVDETTDLYLRDRPSLIEMAQQMPRYVSSAEVSEVEEMKNWTASFSLKAKTRILGRLSVTTEDLAAVPIGMYFQIALLHGIKFFKKMRPVFVEPT